MRDVTAVAVTLAAVVLCCAVCAQDLEPRAYSNSPTGLNFLIAGYSYATGSVLTDPALPLEKREQLRAHRRPRLRENTQRVRQIGKMRSGLCPTTRSSVTAVSRDRSQTVVTASYPTGALISMARNPNALCPGRTDRVNFRKPLPSLTGFCVYILGLGVPRNGWPCCRCRAPYEGAQNCFHRLPLREVYRIIAPS
jgi:hypothetical protein